MNEEAEGKGKPQPNPDDAVRELVWVLRRAMYFFIVWAEKRYGWKQRPSSDDDR